MITKVKPVVVKLGEGDIGVSIVADGLINRYLTFTQLDINKNIRKQLEEIENKKTIEETNADVILEFVNEETLDSFLDKLLLQKDKINGEIKC